MLKLDKKKVKYEYIAWVSYIGEEYSQNTAMQCTQNKVKQCQKQYYVDKYSVEYQSVPVNLFPLKSRDSRAVKSPMLSGMVPIGAHRKFLVSIQNTTLVSVKTLNPIYNLCHYFKIKHLF